MSRAEKGDWVRVQSVVLTPEKRAPNIPSDTGSVPLQIWMKGYLEEPADLGDMVQITTITGRLASGTLVEVNPHYDLGFGEFRDELHRISRQVKDLAFGEDETRD